MNTASEKDNANGFRRLLQFLNDKRGAFAMQFGLMVIPLVLCVGLAIDGGRVFLARFNLMSALDAAALAMGSTTDDSVDLHAMADLYVAQNFRMADTGTVVLTSTPTTITSSTEEIKLHGTVSVDTYFMPIVGIAHVDVSAESVVKRGGADVEVALVLDTTGSMGGTKIADLKTAANELIDIVVNPVQTPWYSKVAVVPYSNSVYLGAKADTVRGAPPAGVDITAGSIPPAPAKLITDITNQDRARVYSTNHGFSNGDIITISGVTGMTQINGGTYKVRNAETNRFRIKYEGGPNDGDWVNSNSWPSYSSGGEISGDGGGAGCADPCVVTLTAPNHGFSNNDWIRIEGASGWGEMNNSGDEGFSAAWQIENVTTNTFTLKDSEDEDPQDWGTYTGNGKAYCTTLGCQYYRYQSNGDGARVEQLSQCVTERIGSEQYTNASYTTKGVGYMYPAGSGVVACDTNNDIVPLTANATSLETEINALTTNGYTSGHIGLAWGYYTLSPTFNTLWTSASEHAGPMVAQDLVKAIVFMTDGQFNTAYCNGVISKDSEWSNDDKANCNANNGEPFDQAEALCNSIKADGITIYTVGFAVGATSDEAEFLEGCASEPEYYYLASDGPALTAAFNSIAKSISLLRLAK